MGRTSDMCGENVKYRHFSQKTSMEEITLGELSIDDGIILK
jgi:hypothetical protein